MTSRARLRGGPSCCQKKWTAPTLLSLVPPAAFFCLLLLLLLHGLEGFLEQGVFRSRAHWQASLMKAAAQNALVEISMGGGVQLVAVIEQVVFIRF